MILQLKKKSIIKSDAKDLDLEHEAFELLVILTDDERIIVLLRVFDEMSFKEISKIVNRFLLEQFYGVIITLLKTVR